MNDETAGAPRAADAPDSTAVRTALWRALHVEVVTMARDAGFVDVRHVPGRELADRYFAGRPDGLRPSSGEDFIVATT